jgi:hypothetical protein
LLDEERPDRARRHSRDEHAENERRMPLHDRDAEQ